MQVTGPEQVPVVAPGGSRTARVDGFDWLDAGIGVAAALGLGLIVMGGVVLALRRPIHPTACRLSSRVGLEARAEHDTAGVGESVGNVQDGCAMIA